MTKPALKAALALALAPYLLGNGAAVPPRLAQALSNYEALQQGRRQIGQFNRQELADILEVERALNGKKPRTRSQRCFDEEISKLGGSPSQLARRVIDLKCSEIGERSY